MSQNGNRQCLQCLKRICKPYKILVWSFEMPAQVGVDTFIHLAKERRISFAYYLNIFCDKQCKKYSWNGRDIWVNMNNVFAKTRQNSATITRKCFYNLLSVCNKTRSFLPYLISWSATKKIYSDLFSSFMSSLLRNKWYLSKKKADLKTIIIHNIHFIFKTEPCILICLM